MTQTLACNIETEQVSIKAAPIHSVLIKQRMLFTSLLHQSDPSCVSTRAITHCSVMYNDTPRISKCIALDKLPNPIHMSQFSKAGEVTINQQEVTLTLKPNKKNTAYFN